MLEVIRYQDPRRYKSIWAKIQNFPNGHMVKIGKKKYKVNKVVGPYARVGLSPR